MMKILLLLLLGDVVDDAYGDAALNIIIIHSFSFTIHHASYHRQATTKDVFFDTVKQVSKKAPVKSECLTFAPTKIDSHFCINILCIQQVSDKPKHHEV